jgi:hypothetical protein
VSRTVPARTIRARRTPPAGSSTLPLTRSRTCDARVLNRTPCPGQAKHGKMIFRASRVPTGRNRHHRSVPRRPAPARRHARAGTLLTGFPSGSTSARGVRLTAAYPGEIQLPSTAPGQYGRGMC